MLHEHRNVCGIQMKKKKDIWLILVILIIALALIEKAPMCCYLDSERAKGPIDSEPTPLDVQTEKQALEDEGILSLYVWGSSMYPTIKPGQTCICQEKTQYEKGDIIAFHVYENDHLTFVVHRVVEATEAGVITMGDNNVVEDPWLIPYDNIFCSIPEKYQLKEVDTNGD